MIELIKNNQKDEKSWELKINGQLVRNIKFSKILGLNFYVSIDKTSSIFFEQEICSFLSLCNDLDMEKFEIDVDLGNLFEKEERDLFTNELFKEDEDGDDFAKISLNFVLHSNNDILIKIKSFAFFFNPTWIGSFSLINYARFVQNEIASGFESEYIKEGVPVDGFELPLPNTKLTLIDAIHLAVEKFKSAHQKAFNELSKKAKDNSLTTKLLNFPEEVRIPCEQYLLYFAEFLRDLGVNATTDITHEAGEILFRVTPSDSDQALDRIKFALDVFLQLPKGELVIVPDPDFEIAMLKVKANVDHLNSQLSLAKAEIKVKEREIQAFEATLETKDISIEFLREKLNQQKRLLNGEIAEGIIDIEPKPKVEDKEEFFDGVFALTQYEEKGFRVNLAQLYRKLKTYLKSE